MIEADKAQKLAHGWIAAWNNHDIDEILSHYCQDVIFTSPFVAKLLGDSSGTVVGKEALKSYFIIGLEIYPDLKFELINVLSGIGSIALYYKSVNELYAAEVMYLGSNDKIIKVIAHYR